MNKHVTFRTLWSCLITLGMLVVSQRAWAEYVKLTALDGTNNGNPESEYFDKLVDANPATKWFSRGNNLYIIVKADKPVVPKHYFLVTGNDTNQFPDRNWKQWKIYGGNFSSDALAIHNSNDWTLIDNRYNESLPTQNFGVANFEFNMHPTATYQYFMIDRISSNNSTQSGGEYDHQMSEWGLGTHEEFVQYLDETGTVNNVGISGIYYNLSGNEAEVTYKDINYNSYSGTVDIPNYVTFNGKTYTVNTIGNYAFKDCSNLVSVRIPTTLKKVKIGAFDGCTSLAKVIVTDIAAWCGIVYDGGNYNGDFPLGRAHHLFSDENTEITEIVIPEGVTRIEALAFRDAKFVTSVTIPNSVNYIGEEAFRGMYGLTSINLPQEITYIEPRTFDDCQALPTIIIPDKVTSIGDYAFCGCFSLSSLTLNDSLIEIGTRAFQSTNLKNLVIPNNVQTIGGWAFENYNNNPSLESVVLGESLDSLLYGAFMSQTNLKKVICLAVNPPTIEDQSVFSVYDTLYVTSGRENAYKNADYWKKFKYIKGFTPIIDAETDLPSNRWSGLEYAVKAIAYDSGTNYGEMTEYNPNYNKIVGIPSNDSYERTWYDVDYICNWSERIAPHTNWCWKSSEHYGDIYARRTFYFEGELPEELYLACGHDDAPCEYYLNGTLIWSETDGWFREEIFKLTPDQISLLRPGEENVLAFHVHQNWGSMYADCGLYTSLSNIGISNECGDNLSWDFDNESGALTISGTGDMYDNMIWAGFHSQIKQVIIQPGVTSIGIDAFGNCQSLTSISIPESVNSIGKLCFQNCANLTSITIPNGVTNIEEQTFEGCRGLTSIIIPDGVTDINISAFNRCSNLTSITIPSSVTNIGNYSFEGCPALTDFYCYAETVPSTGNDIFRSSPIESATLHVPAGSLNRYKNTLPWSGFGNIQPIFDRHTLTYVVDGEVYKTYEVEEGTAITPEPVPTKEGYTFSGWIGMPATMPTEDTTVTGYFTINSYTLTYLLNGEVYSTETVVYGTPLIPEPGLKREGYTFTGWSEVPETMPAHDVIITGAFYPNGDVNADNEVDVVDVVDIARFVIGTPATTFWEVLADINKDGIVNLGDAVVLVNDIAGNQNFVKAWHAPICVTTNDRISLNKRDGKLSLSLENERWYTAFQFDLYVPENIDVSKMMLNAERKHGHQLLYNKIENGHYRVAALSTSNHEFYGNDGELLNITLSEGDNIDASIQNIHFFDTEGHDYQFDDINPTATGFIDMRNSQDENDALIYDLQGRKLEKLHRGINIVGAKKIIVK